MENVSKRLAVLVGCNYPSTKFKLNGCINDALAMKDLLLKRFGFQPSDVQLLTDELDSLVLPTGANIKAALQTMVDKAKAGDVLFFHFSGHGTTIPSLDPGQPYREDEAIVPCDLNFITDMDLRQLIRKLPVGSSFTILSDSCHSGGLIDKDKEQIGPSTIDKQIPSVYLKSRGLSIQSIADSINAAAHIVGVVATAADTASGVAGTIGSIVNGIFGNKNVSLTFQPDKQKDLLKSLTEDEGILLSGCQANQTSADVAATPSNGGIAHGAFTSAFLQVLQDNPGNSLSTRELVTKTRKVLKENGFEQKPCLYCSDANADTPFLDSHKLPKDMPTRFLYHAP